ncbi:MAG: hypothetical protein AAFO02_18965, partial [Bacteroidota bacterium]
MNRVATSFGFIRFPTVFSRKTQVSSRRAGVTVSIWWQSHHLNQPQVMFLATLQVYAVFVL